MYSSLTVVMSVTPRGLSSRRSSTSRLLARLSELRSSRLEDNRLVEWPRREGATVLRNGIRRPQHPDKALVQAKAREAPRMPAKSARDLRLAVRSRKTTAPPRQKYRRRPSGSTKPAAVRGDRSQLEGLVRDRRIRLGGMATTVRGESAVEVRFTALTRAGLSHPPDRPSGVFSERIGSLGSPRVRQRGARRGSN